MKAGRRKTDGFLIEPVTTRGGCITFGFADRTAAMEWTGFYDLVVSWPGLVLFGGMAVLAILGWILLR